MGKPTPDLGATVIVATGDGTHHADKIVQQVGQYRTTESGVRFHVADDRVGPRAWHVDGYAVYLGGES